MPNNSNARREKDKKKQSKKKKTDPPPLHKEDKASMDNMLMDSIPHPLSLSGKDEGTMDISSSSLSLAGADKETPSLRENVILMDFYRSLSEDEKTNMHVKALEANPGASAKELIVIKCVALWKAIHEAQKKKSQDEKDSSLPSPLIGLDNEKELHVRGPAQKALLDEFRLSLSHRRKVVTFMRKSGRKIRMQTQRSLLRTFVQQC